MLVYNTLVIIIYSCGYKGELETVKLLNECEADLEICDYDMRTVAHLAASENHFELLFYLIEFSKFNFNLKDRWDHTPLEEIKNIKIKK